MKHDLHIVILYVLIVLLSFTVVKRTYFRLIVDRCTVFEADENGKLPDLWKNYGKPSNRG